MSEPWAVLDLLTWALLAPWLLVAVRLVTRWLVRALWARVCVPWPALIFSRPSAPPPSPPSLETTR